MLGFGSLSEAPLATLPQDGVALFTMTGAGALSAVGASVASAVFSMNGAGAASFVGSANSFAALSAAGAATVTWYGIANSLSAFSFAGFGNLFALAVPKTPATRTATVQNRSRVLVLQRDSRDQTVPVYGERSATVLSLSRTLLVPPYPRIIVNPQVQG